MKLKEKKGFSLVELMIVVVIMGILVAVAIPLYNAVTDNARANTCKNNQRELRAMFAKWILMNENNTADSFFSTSQKSFDGSTQNPESVLPADFLNSFNDGKLPTCPEENHHYVITKTGAATVSIQCISDGEVDEDHAVEN